MAEVNIKQSGFIYKNPKPFLKSENAYFPSVVECDNGDLVAAVVIGEAFEAVNLHSVIFRSKDNGNTWEKQGRLYKPQEDYPVSECCRIAKDKDGNLSAFIIQHNRMLTDQGLTNPENIGFVPTELLMSFSNDNGYTWSKPSKFTPPLTGPEFEMCSPVMYYKDKCLLATSTWRDWNGYCPEGMKMVAFRSYDNGKTWPEFTDVMDRSKDNIIFWESKIISVGDMLVATAWAYDEKNSCDLENHYSISNDGGKTFGKEKSTGLQGQTLTPMYLGNGKILCAYRRIDKKGLWLNLSTVKDGEWVNLEAIPLWGTKMNKLTEHTENMAQNFNNLKFGAPHLLQLKDGSVLLTFWCVEDGSGMVRYIKFDINV